MPLGSRGILRFCTPQACASAPEGVKHRTIQTETLPGLGDRLVAAPGAREHRCRAEQAFGGGGAGRPGVGFNFFVGNTNVNHGLSSFDVDTYD